MSKSRKNNWSFGVIPPEKLEQALQFAIEYRDVPPHVPQWVQLAIQAEIAKERAEAMTPEDHSRILAHNAFFQHFTKNG